MTSELAAGDIEDLRAAGLSPSDEDIIRLHALALRISNGKETTAYNFPRFALAGGVVFFEPTMAARVWYSFARSFAEDTETEDWMFAFACANGRKRDYLDRLDDPAEIERELGRFVSSITATKAEVERAVFYAAVGHDDVEAEKTELAKQHEREAAKNSTREQRNYAALEELIANAAAATGLSFEDIMLQTHSRLRGMIYAAHVQAGLTLTKSSAKAHADYLATLMAIEKRLRQEKAATATDVASV